MEKQEQARKQTAATLSSTANGGAATVEPTPRTRLKRLPKRAAYDRATIYSILDTALVCHVGFAAGGQPYVIPTLHVRLDDNIYIHGSAASRMLGTAADGAAICITVTHIDGLVLARSAFHHSVNYRSVVVLGTARLVEDPAEKTAVLKGLIDHIAPGRWDSIRAPEPKELAATSVLCVPITEASAKVRSGFPIDDEADYAMPIWAGQIPLATTTLAPIVDPRVAPGIAIPSHVSGYRLPANRGGHNGGDAR